MENAAKRNIVISAINSINAGSLTILKECLRCLADNFSDRYTIIALVNNKDLFDQKNIIYYEFPKSKKAWVNRLYYEYLYFRKFSKKINPYLWFSLHDITPNVKTEILAVYCHNPSPFYKVSVKDIKLDFKFFLFNLFYKYLYKLNIKKNDYVVVQQNWLRREFRKLYGIDNIIVAYPNINVTFNCNRNEHNGVFRFLYPAYPRLFKNFEVICSAAKILLDNGINNFEVYLTINGTENKYARYIYKKFKDIGNIKFLGLQSRDKIYELYGNSDCLIFPSKLETWGAPVTEYKKFEKPILLADLEYAHETIGDYNKVRFFNPDNPIQLSNLMSEFMENKLIFETVNKNVVEHPFASTWEELFNLLLKKE